MIALVNDINSFVQCSVMCYRTHDVHACVIHVHACALQACGEIVPPFTVAR